MELTAFPAFETSDSTAKLDSALAKAQGEIEAATKDKTNPAFRSRYADLTAVWEACREALAKHSISVTQWPVHSADGRLHIVTRVAHAGEWIRAHFSVPVGKQDAQGYGSAVTYAKRYALSAAVGVVADDDDDGEAATDRGAPRTQKRTPARRQREAQPTNGNGATRQQAGPRLISEAQLKRLWAIASGAGWSRDGLRALLAEAGIESSKEIPVEIYDELCTKAENADLAAAYSGEASAEAMP